MVSDDIRDFYFYQEYLWREEDFDNFQTWANARVEGLAEGAFGASVLSGLRADAVGGLNVTIKAGIGVNEDGRLMVLEDDTNVSFAAPSTFPRWDLIVARPVDTDMTDIPDPQNPSGPQVPLHKKKGMSITRIAGSESPSPSFPSAAAGDIVLCGVKLTVGMTFINFPDIDLSPRQALGVNHMNPKGIDEDYSALVTDRYLGASGGNDGITITLPDPWEAQGESITIVKEDAATGAVNVFSASGISGQTILSIDDQWGNMKVFAQGLSWRVI